jgi:hypothetical protein
MEIALPSLPSHSSGGFMEALNLEARFNPRAACGIGGGQTGNGEGFLRILPTFPANYRPIGGQFPQVISGACTVGPRAAYVPKDTVSLTPVSFNRSIYCSLLLLMFVTTE